MCIDGVFLYMHVYSTVHMIHYNKGIREKRLQRAKGVTCYEMLFMSYAMLYDRNMKNTLLCYAGIHSFHSLRAGTCSRCLTRIRPIKWKNREFK